jgi:1-phosphofructokinase
MIYTVTLNPSLDYIMRLGAFSEGKVNRSEYEAIVVGGKGINVSVMLHELGVASTAFGFIAGFTGEEIRRRVRERGCSERFISLDEGFSRINVKIKTNEESEINGAGPVVSEDALYRFFDMIDELQSGDILVLSGSVPKSIPETIYRDIAERLAGRGIEIAVDASGMLLTDILPYRPFLIKPNHHELSEIFGVSIKTAEDAAHYAGKLQEMGARNVLVSMAEEGAFLLAEDGRAYLASAPRGNVVNSVGAGDSMLAGFLAGYSENGNYRRALSLGIAAGSASAFSEGIASSEAVYALFSNIYVELKSDRKFQSSI